MCRITCAIVALLFVCVAHAQVSKPPAIVQLGMDRFVAGARATSDADVQGDLIATGRDVDIASAAAGDVLAAGRKVRLTGRAGQDLYAAGGEVWMSGFADRNARIAGGNVRLEESAAVKGNVSIAAGEVNVAGNIGGYLQVAARKIYLNGPVGGDVQVTGRQIELGPNADIRGKLRYRSHEELTRAAGARVAGGTQRLPWTHDAGFDGFGGPFFWVWSVGLVVLALLLIALMPRFSRRVAESARLKFGWSVLIGLIVLLFAPAAAAVAMVTIVGIPVGVVLLLLYAMLLPVGYVFGAIALADASLRRMKPDRQDSTAWRMLGAIVALLILAVLAAVPVLGALLGFIALIAGIGALLYQIRAGSRQPLPA